MPESALAYISAASAIIGAGLYFKSKLDDTVRSLATHLHADNELHAKIGDRLARIETKVDVLLEEREK